ncbi:hypothetical protein F4813DRAFT_54132 [Daldinia decipiens]|uniref:uncharacterized protein n=1 Tax=Daldinia decipiens TaxID=326647 RepID=UPI0020C2F271|nr:uncharacterized protein F4813DRAFT_54132 [Daldinia decipiens]KAI1658111.1 hypothetical protein F4813DRAFT_54132 [Daldinia decipiens]
MSYQHLCKLASHVIFYCQITYHITRRVEANCYPYHPSTVLCTTVSITAQLMLFQRLASSNFFMQVLNSPSREEVNAVHFRGSWLGIGIPSIRNAFRVSKFKTTCWICLFISSIPIHLLFNSTIFETDYRGSDFHLTIATEEFLNGGSFYPPGGSLVQAGFSSWYDETGPYKGYPYIVTESTSINFNPWSFYYDGYGSPVNLTEYANKDSDAMKNISTTATSAGQWKRLEISECKQEYINCSGLKRHRNLVLVIDRPGGWIRDEIWHLMDNQTELWDRYVPADQPNHLFYDAQCFMLASRNAMKVTECVNSCIGAFGTGGNNTVITAYASIPDWQYSFFDVCGNESVNGTTILGTSELYEGDKMGSTLTSGLQPGATNLSVQYCLADDLDRVCHIGLSPILLLTVTLCVIFKTFTAIVVTVVLSRQNQAPLVTLGDAMESFIEKPDPVTAGMCTIGQTEIRRSMRSYRSLLLPVPRQWNPLQRRRWAVVPLLVWISSYLLFGIGITTCACFFADIKRHDNLVGSFYESEMNSFIDSPFTFTQGVLIANSPQLLLSFCYLAYNNLFTRLQMAREWSLFSEGYEPLRVTSPKGDQYSTYRLQLPYKYSLPLIATSIFLHWLLSNTIYLFISIGGYFSTDAFLSGIEADPSLPPNTAIALGYSGYSLLVMLVVSCFLILLPAILSIKKLPSNMVIVGSNSLALSAACHVSSLSHAVCSRATSLFADFPAPSQVDLPPALKSSKRSYTPLTDDTYTDEGNRSDSIEMQNLTPMLTTTSRHPLWKSVSKKPLLERSEEDFSDAGDEQQNSQFTKLARSKIRWGVVEMPPEWHAEYDNDDATVGHLSFGVEEDGVTPPEPGCLYA